MRALPPLALVLVASLAPAALGAAELRMLDDGQGGGAAYRFEPARVEAAPGETVRAANGGQDVHTVSHDVDRSQRLFDELAIEPGATREFRAPNTEGTYPFKCAYHPEMTGVLVVEARAPTSGSEPTSGTDFDPAVGEPTPLTGEQMPVPGPGLGVALAAVLLAAVGRRGRA